MVRVLDALQEAAARADVARSVHGTSRGGEVTLSGRQEFLTVAEAAAVRGCSTRAITKAIASGRLPAERHGHSWWIGAADLDQYRYGRSRA
ncbi:excisionase family DNA-binding protein [Curtobacterium sp. MCBA15_001]|uniref:excisionase family DNA-binding protein n=1 Tax=Curtobacterium sp. MCBA15_001 TaxID=1898731 RepID=UPI0034A388B5